MDYLKEIEASGFVVVRRDSSRELPAELQKRYGNIPVDYLDFLQRFERIANDDDTVWFNSLEDFGGESDSEFMWNEFELISLEAVEEDDEESDSIRHFWDVHIPIVISVEGGYEYLAICLDGDRYGEIVHGEEPEFEETTKVCDNFEELISGDFLQHFL